MYAAIIISHFFILMCCFYCYCKILNLNDLFFRLRILFTFSALALACALCFIHFIVYPIAMFFILLTFYIFITLFTKTNWHTSLNATIISIAMSLVSFTISSFDLIESITFINCYILSSWSPQTLVNAKFVASEFALTLSLVLYPFPSCYECSQGQN